MIAYFDQPKAHISENHILLLRGCCAPKFLHVLENDEVLLSHPYQERVFFKNFFLSWF